MRSIPTLLVTGLLALASAGYAADARPATAASEARLVLRADRPGCRIDRNIFGQFSEHLGAGIYGGIWVGQNFDIPNTNGYRSDVVTALKALHVPVLRWPGGCFADLYHWRDGIGPQDKRPIRINTSWGNVEESNEFGLHEFMGFAAAIGADVYVNANVGTGSPQETADLVEYMTSPSKSTLAEERRANGRAEPWKLTWLAIGNETWGCGGNMRPEYYADLIRQYATFVRVPDDRKPKILASGANAEDYNWTKVLMSQAGQYIDGYSLHYYTLPEGNWSHKGSATSFGEKAWIETLSHTLKMEELVRKHSVVMDKYDPKKRVALAVDEWGNWYDAQPGTNPAFLVQQNTLRDALTSAINIDIFVHHADRVRMANIAQMVNVLQAMVQTDGPRMVLTPTYYVFQMYVPFQDATALPLTVKAPDYRFGAFKVPGVYAAAARGKDRLIHIALANLDPNRATRITIQLTGLVASSVDGQVLTADAMDAANTFDKPDTVKPAPFTGATLGNGALTATLPPKSLVMLTLNGS